MSIWTRLVSSKKSEDKVKKTTEHSDNKRILKYAVIDIEVSLNDDSIRDIGALKPDGSTFHAPMKSELFLFLNGVEYVCGHNIFNHDIKYLFSNDQCPWKIVDTLYMSPLLFPERPYHRLLKDDKIISDQINNPLNDCKKANDLLLDEISAWNALSEKKRAIYTSLLHGHNEFDGFLDLVGAERVGGSIKKVIKEVYNDKICSNADLDRIISDYPSELAYALAIIDTSEHHSISPSWVLYTFPEIENIVRILCNTRCKEGCAYCRSVLDAHHNLKAFFGYDEFRTYEGEPLQEKAVNAAINGKSLLAIFPTGGGKSITFQLPALIASRTVHGLTVVISPLQSLMKDQVDSLNSKGITDAVTINGQLDPISRSLSIQRVLEGEASILYISPEMLRSKTIERILHSRHIVRFVIDEAHCFSAWGHDFRVDYLYIGKFIRNLQNAKKIKSSIPVSCFTATAKQKVIQDIRDYFKQTLDLDLELYASSASRTNLHYSVLHLEKEEDKYQKLRGMIAASECPAIVYVSRTKKTKDLAERLSRDGYKAVPYNGKMDPEQKIANQEAFMEGRVSVIVATSAFGMGIDKKDVGLVIHYDISDSLENYVQEAGRAGRDPNLDANCYVLYSDDDLNKHFILLNQTKLSISEIQQVWRAIKNLTHHRTRVSCSALEIARQAGWDDSLTTDVETRIKTALATLEQGGYIVRGNNVPHVYATGITVKNVDDARERISASALFEKDEIETAVRIIKSLISQKYTYKSKDSDAESRVDYLADILGLSKWEVVSVVERMRQEGILADSQDISAFLTEGATLRKSKLLLDRFVKLERYIINSIPDDGLRISCKQLNENAVNSGIGTSREKHIRTLLYFLIVKKYISKKGGNDDNMEICRQADSETIMTRFEKRLYISNFAISWLYGQVAIPGDAQSSSLSIKFSIIELLKRISEKNEIDKSFSKIDLKDVEETLLYLSTIGAIRLEGGFLVLYNGMDIKRVKDSRARYRVEDYRALDEFYKLKIQQVHIVGEYANLMVKDYNAALQFVHDYFHIDYKDFISKYFKGDRSKEIQRSLTPQKYSQIFSQLSSKQMEIISDEESHCIVVAAGPGSGKTRVLVHKLASLLLLEDVKHEQLLMLTFSKAATTEFKQRLIGLIGNAAHYVDIKTFHSYCFDLLGRIGNIEESADVVEKAAEMIREGEVEPSKIGKTVLVIDEAQDMGRAEYELVRALIDNNEEMRVIVVGDDDQNIYDFRGSDSGYMYKLSQDKNSTFVEMVDNYRSARHVVDFANDFLKTIQHRIKVSPIKSMSEDKGYVEITHYRSKYMYQPLADSVLKHRIQGTSCVLTQTNEEAVIVNAYLNKRGIKCKLIQSMDGLRFWNLAEVRYFLKCLAKRKTTPLISDELWNDAKNATIVKYDRSNCLIYLQRCIAQFEETNKVKYINDFREFVFESSVEDFCESDRNEVVVSTIHKAKGREFDDVYMLISDSFTNDDNLKRRHYVGMTRAKTRLFVHTDCDYFDNLKADLHKFDNNQYSIPEQVVLQLSHRDVKLGFFKEHKQEVLSLRSGDKLIFKDNMLYSIKTHDSPVAVLSIGMQKTLAGWIERGYKVTSASARFVVAWKPKDAPKEEKESAVLLADLTLTR